MIVLINLLEGGVNGTHRFLILLFGASGFLGLLNDGVQGEAQAAHAGQVGHIDVKLQLLVPQWLRAHHHLRARHHLTEQLAAVEQAGLHHELEGDTRTGRRLDGGMTCGLKAEEIVCERQTGFGG